MKTHLQRRQERQSGSVIVEFILVFPAFLILCLFTIEVSLMWADKHIMRLAAFEAARVLVSADLPYYEADGTRQDDPCKASGVMQPAYQAAIRRMAIITTPLQIYIAKMKSGVLEGLVGQTPSLPKLGAGPALLRLIERWPTAVIQTKLDCTFDSNTGLVRVELRYDRIPATPIIDRVMWMLSKLQEQSSSAFEFDLDPLFFTVDGRYRTHGSVAAAKKAIADSLATIKDLGLAPEQASDFLAGVPGAAHIFANIPSMPVGISSFIEPLGSAADARIQAIVTTYSRILTAVYLAVPDAMRTVPIRTNVELARTFYRDGSSVNGSGVVEEPAWPGNVHGAMEFSGDYRNWGKELSTSSQDLTGGTAL